MSKRIMVALVVMLIGLTACASTQEAEKVRRFKTISDEGAFTIIYDTETKVQYAKSNVSYNLGSLCLLVNADGTPLLYMESDKQ